MKTAKVALIILVLCCWMLLGLAACDWDETGEADSSRMQYGSLSYEATAAAGERQLYIQLTAIAGEQRLKETGRINP
jgi:hypothetical protein